MRLDGEFGEKALDAVRAQYPWRQVTRCGPVIVVWPLGTAWVSHQPSAVILRGHFDERDNEALRAAYPGRTVSRDGELLTVWPPTTPIARQGTTEENAR